MEGSPYVRRLLALEQRFGELEPGIPGCSEKEALSVLNGMVQELSRSLRSVASPPALPDPVQDLELRLGERLLGGAGCRWTWRSATG